MRALAACAAAALCLVASAAAASGPTAASIVTTCPTAADVASIDGALHLTFTNDPTAGTFVCRAAEGSRDLTRLQAHVYEGLLAMRAMSFVQPLPWTSASLYTWLTGAIQGIDFNHDVSTSFCCSAPKTIVIQTQTLAAATTDTWIDPRSGAGIGDLVDVVTHEARHAEGPVHTCGANDQTLDENGAWAIEYYTRLWEGLYAGSFLDVAAPYAAYARDVDVGDAESFLQRICTLPKADLSVKAAVSSPTVDDLGGRLTYTITVANAGPDAAPHVWATMELPAGTTYASSSSGCVSVPSVQATCDAGSLTAGGTKSFTVSVDVSAKPGTTLDPRELSIADGIRVTGTVSEPDYANDRADATATVVAHLALTQTSVIAVAGKALVVRGTLTGAGGATPTIACAAALAGKRLGQAAVVSGARPSCTWRLPRSAAGKQATGTLIATVGGSTARRAFTVRVHR